MKIHLSTAFGIVLYAMFCVVQVVSALVSVELSRC